MLNVLNHSAWTTLKLNGLTSQYSEFKWDGKELPKFLI